MINLTILNFSRHIIENETLNQEIIRILLFNNKF
jgi:hypothetical protein